MFMAMHTCALIMQLLLNDRCVCKLNSNKKRNKAGSGWRETRMDDGKCEERKHKREEFAIEKVQPYADMRTMEPL